VKSRTFDTIWERDIYGQGQHLNRYPFDCVVSFIYRYAPRGKPRASVRILEVGCGGGNNLWFAAREGFAVSGIDGSASAIAFAHQRFAAEGLVGDLRVGDFTQLPYQSDVFDLVIDRGALTCCGWSAMRQAVGEVGRVLAPGGRFHFNPYHVDHSSAEGARRGPDDLLLDICQGTLVGVGQIQLVDRAKIETLFATGWRVLSCQELHLTESTQLGRPTMHAEWRVVAERL
jgi:SAM-dependent methyltransferase